MLGFKMVLFLSIVLIGLTDFNIENKKEAVQPFETASFIKEIRFLNLLIDLSTTSCFNNFFIRSLGASIIRSCYFRASNTSCSSCRF